jgi:hypothetical protein
MSNELKVGMVGVQGAHKIEGLGMVVAWSPNGDADLQKMADAFAGIGFGEYAPSPRELKEALRAALVGEFSKKNRRVAPCDPGYEVTQEIKIDGEVRNRHEHILSAWIERDQSGAEIVCVDDPGMVDHVHQWVEEARKKVDSTAIGAALTKTVDALKGIKIRDAGGAYWLPPASVARWLQLAEALNNAGRPVRLREFEQAATARTVASVLDAVEAHVSSTLDAMLTEIEKGTLGERALSKKQQETMDLADQLTEYETVLGEKLDAVRSRIAEVNLRAVQAESVALSRKDERARARELASMYSDQPGV